MAGDRSVSAGGNIIGSAIATGDHATAKVVNNHGITGTELVQALGEIKALLAGIPNVDPKTETRMREALAEAAKPEPDRQEVATLLGQAITYAKKADGFLEVSGKLVERVKGLGATLGPYLPAVLGLGG